MIYDLVVEILKLCGGTIGYFKVHPEALGVLILLLRQNSIKKIINQKLPKRFRDTHESDLLEILDNTREIKVHLGVESSNTQLNGQKTIRILSYKRFFLFLRKAHIPRRLNLMSFLSGKKKIIAFAIAILVNGLNDVFNLNLSPQTVDVATWVSGGYIAVEFILDALRALSVRFKKTTTAGALINVAYTTFQEAIPFLKTVHDGINKLLEDVKKDDGSQAFKDAMQAYTAIQAIIEANKHPEPIQTITEHKEAS